MLMIERSLSDGLWFAAFQPNEQRTWRMIEASAGAFLNQLWRSGAFPGARPDDAFQIRSGFGATMSQADLDAGRIIVEVGVAPLKPAEFMLLRIALSSARRSGGRPDQAA